MANGSSRVLVVLVSLVVGFAAGWGLFSGPKKPLPARPSVAQDWKIFVGPDDPCVLKDANGNDASVQRVARGKHHIEWESADRKSLLYIIAHVPPCEIAPFPKWQKIGTDSNKNDLYLIGDGTSSKVDSGKPDLRACPSNDTLPKTWIKYDQYLQIYGQPGPPVFRSCDGMIIIDP